MRARRAASIVVGLVLSVAGCDGNGHGGGPLEDAGAEWQEAAQDDATEDDGRAVPDADETAGEDDGGVPAEDEGSPSDSPAEDWADFADAPEAGWCECGAGYCACLAEGDEVPALFAGTAGEPGKLDPMLAPLLYCRTQEEVAAIAAELARALEGETDPSRIDALRREYARRFEEAVGWPVAIDVVPDGTPLVHVFLEVTDAGEAAERVRCAGGRCSVPEPTITILTASLPVPALATLTALYVITHVTASTPVDPAGP